MSLSRQLRWILATTVGLAIVGFGLHFPGSLPSNLLEWDIGAAAFGAALGVISGVIVGSMQWFLRAAPLGSAVLTMAAGIGISHGLADGAPYFFGLVPIAIISAIVLTGALSLAHGERRPMVLLASFVGWAGGWFAASAVSAALGLPWTVDQVGWATQHAIAGIVHGIVWAGPTGAAGFPTVRTAHAELLPLTRSRPYG